MSDLQPETTAEISLRKSFPSLYITLVSIVVALAVEGLLGRIGELGELGWNLSSFVLYSQMAHFVWTASMFWWIAARWVTTIPWPFGMFDGLSMILMLIGLYLLSQSIGGPFAGWLLIMGLFAFAGAFVYRFNGARGIRLTGRSEQTAKLHLVPTVFSGLTGLGCSLLALIADVSAWSPVYQLLVVDLILILTVVFTYLDYWIWNRASQEPGNFD